LKGHDISRKFYAYFDGELDAGRVEALERHLMQCPACSQEVAEIRRFYSIMQHLPSTRLPEDFAATTVRKAVRAAHDLDFRTWWRNLTWPWRWAACAATLAGLLVGGISYQMAVIDQDLVAAQRESRFLISDASLSESYAIAVWKGENE
jgi:anti-sigma factor RsiW